MVLDFSFNEPPVLVLECILERFWFWFQFYFTQKWNLLNPVLGPIVGPVLQCSSSFSSESQTWFSVIQSGIGGLSVTLWLAPSSSPLFHKKKFQNFWFWFSFLSGSSFGYFSVLILHLWFQKSDLVVVQIYVTET